MRETFGKFGKLTDCNIARQPGGISRGFGFVTFEDARDAEEARERYDIDGVVLVRSIL